MERMYLWLSKDIDKCKKCEGSGIEIINDDLFSIQDCNECIGTGVKLNDE